MASEFRINIVIDPSSADRGVRVVERRLNQLSSQADNLRNLLGRALTGLGLAFTGKQLMELADEFTSIQNKLATVTEGTGDLANKTEELFQIANRTRVSYAATAELYARVARSAKVLGRTQTEVTKFTETLSKSLIVSGASSQEARAGLIQLSQGIASGVLRGDELRSVLEQLPYTADIIAKQLGVTRNELREFGEQGKLSADLILDAFKNAADEVDAAFAKTTPTLGQAFTILRNNLVNFIGETDKANGITAFLSKNIIKLSENIETAARGIVALSVLLGASQFLSVMKEASAAVYRFGIALLANPITVLPTLIAAGIAALVAFGDQIKVSENGLATLQDVAVVVLPKILKFFGDLASAAIDWATILTGTALPSIESVLMTIAEFIDTAIAYFNGFLNWAGAYWDLFASYPEVAIYDAVIQMIDNISYFVDVLLTVGKTIADVFVGVGKAILDGTVYAGKSALSLLSGDLDGATKAADQSVESFKSIGKVFTDIPSNFKRDLDLLSGPGAASMFKDTAKAAVGELFGAEVVAKSFEAGVAISNAFEQGFEDSLSQGAATQLVGGFAGGARATIEGVLKEAEARAKARDDRQKDLVLEKKIAAEKQKQEDLAVAARGPVLELTKEQMELYQSLSGNLKQVRADYENLEKLRQANEMRKRDKNMVKNWEFLGLTDGQLDRGMDQLTVKALESATTIEAGFQRAFAKIRLEATDFASVAESSFMVLADVGTDALTKLVTEGSISFKDLARDAIAQLAQIISRLLMMQLLSSTLGFLGFTPASGAGVALSGAMATGGTTQPGRSYLVGERGPEVFTPGQTGVVSPNPGSMASAPPQVNVQVVNVNDPNEVPTALNSGRADQAILNVLRRNRQTVQRITG